MKKDRKNAILDIVTKYEIDTQETLQALLLERGFNVTQATVSRDIKQLSLTKTLGENGNYKYTLPVKSEEKKVRRAFETLFADSVSTVDRANRVRHTATATAGNPVPKMDSNPLIVRFAPMSLPYSIF